MGDSRRTMRHVFKHCMDDDHENCESEFNGDLHEGLCICYCHLASVVRMYLAADATREDLRRMVDRYQ